RVVGAVLMLGAPRSWVTPVVGMVVFSTASALAFVWLALSPRLLARMPRSGEWLQTVRVLIGVLEVAAAIKFVSNTDVVLGWGVFTREAVLILWLMLVLIAAGYLATKVIRRRRELGLRSMLPAFMARPIAFWLWTGLYASLPQLESFLPPRIQTA